MKIKFVEPLAPRVPVTGSQIGLPQQPGAGTTPTPQAWGKFRRPAA